MAGKPLVDDDDLIVELEDDTPGFKLPEGDEEVADFKQPEIESSTLPDEVEDENALELEDGEETDRRQPVIDEPYDDSYERIAAIEESQRQERAGAIYEIAKANAEVAEAQINNAKVGLNTLDERLERAYEALAMYAEGGDVANRVKVERDIRAMEQLKGEIQTGLAQAPTKNQILEQGRQRAQQVLAQQPQGKKVGSGIQARHPLAERWATANGWMRTNSVANNFVIKQSEDMTQKGYDPNSPAFYAELSKRVQNAYPNLKVSALQATKRGPSGKNTMRSPVAPSRSASDGGALRNANGKTRFVLNTVEKKKMASMNLDPTNPKHAKAWAEVRLKRAAGERRPAR